MKNKHKCPICKEDMSYIRDEFRCVNCLQKHVLKEYELPTLIIQHCWDEDGDYGIYNDYVNGTITICRVRKNENE